MLGIGVGSGGVWTAPPGYPNRHALRMDRTYEFDSMNDHLPDYVLNELLPAVEKLQTKDGRAVHLSRDGNDHAVTGGSTGGIGSFTLAWHRPDQFTRVYDVIGTFVSMRGGHEYPALIRKTEPKPIRIFLEDGSKDACGLASSSDGERIYVSDPAAAKIYVFGAEGLRGVLLDAAPPITAETCGSDGVLYAVDPAEKKVVAIDTAGGGEGATPGPVRTVATGIAGRAITVTHDGTLYVSEPGEHSDMPSHIWMIKPNGDKKLVDEGLLSVSGIAFSPDAALFVAAENTTKLDIQLRCPIGWHFHG